MKIALFATMSAQVAGGTEGSIGILLAARES
jgi:hypothetical protein